MARASIVHEDTRMASNVALCDGFRHIEMVSS